MLIKIILCFFSIYIFYSSNRPTLLGGGVELKFEEGDLNCFLIIIVLEEYDEWIMIFINGLHYKIKQRKTSRFP